MTPSTANIRTFLDLSTGHLTPATRDKLDEWCGAIDLTRKSHSADGPPTLMGATDCGWFVYTMADTEGMPADLAECMAYACNEDCSYILFDCDGPYDKSLPVYEEAEESEVTDAEVH